jgi:hypothetical protein
MQRTASNRNLKIGEYQAAPSVINTLESQDQLDSINNCNKNYSNFPFLPPKLKRMNGMCNIFEKVEKVSEAVNVGASEGVRKYLSREKLLNTKQFNKLVLA